MSLLLDGDSFAHGEPHPAICPYCDDSLRGNVSGLCPECGNPVPKAGKVVLLRWERRCWGGPVVAFVGTLLGAIMHPHQVLRALRGRTEVPIRRPWTFVGFVVATAVVISGIGTVLATFVPIAWNFGSLASGWRAVRMEWNRPLYELPLLVHKLGDVVEFLFAVGAASLIVQWVQRGRTQSCRGFRSCCVVWAMFLLPCIPAG
jgi:hypothetical protein